MTDIVERLRAQERDDGIRIEAANKIELLRAEYDLLRERCEAYKGQVKSGSDEIERLRAQMESGNYLTENDKLRLAIERQALEIKERDDRIASDAILIERLRAALLIRERVKPQEGP